MVAIDFSKQQLINAVSKEIKQVHFIVNVEHVGETQMLFILEEFKETLFILEEFKETILDFLLWTVKVWQRCSVDFIWFWYKTSITMLMLSYHKVKSEAKTAIATNLGLSWIIMINNFPHNLLLTNRQVTSLCKAFANSSWKDVKLSKTQISQVIQSGRFFGRPVAPLPKVGVPLMKNVLTPLVKTVLIPLQFTAASSVANARTHLKILTVWNNNTNTKKQRNEMHYENS